MSRKERTSSPLTEEDCIRYNRQIIFQPFGEEGQKKLKQSHVLIAGIGGLGSPVAVYLTYAGVGHLTVVDADLVELSDLNRQILYWDEDIGESKVFSAVKKLKRMNSTVHINPIPAKITSKNIIELLQNVTLVIDCLDNFKTRFILNEGCVQEDIPLIHGGIDGLRGEVTTIIPGRTPCLRCIFPRAPKEKGPFPVIGASPSIIASLQVMEAIKLLSGFGELLTGKMLYVHGKEMEFFIVKHQKKSGCQTCGMGNK
ncbi:MAG: HesA/MoeB/ThiF family protein [Thermodesulfobacteriota bacterium]|nr:HesA/MoeB/ThiF family protein [Thermodesulfobacteriota bacterium]